MKLYAVVALFFSVFQASFANEDFVLGMKGLQEAAKDPKVLAQLMQDLNNPETMAEAKKMMENPEWKDEMRKLKEQENWRTVIDGAKQTTKNENKFRNKLDEMTHGNVKDYEAQLELAYDRALKELVASTENSKSNRITQKNMAQIDKQVENLMNSKDPNVQALMEMVNEFAKTDDAKKAFARANSNMKRNS